MSELLNLLYIWFIETGWIPVLTCLNLLLFARMCFWAIEMNRRMSAIEFKYSGLMERVINLRTDISRSNSQQKQQDDGNNNDTILRGK